ncbi:MFS transporter [Natrinema pallidum]|uniref:dolichyl-phosphooligosaccharide-protein glycotransferase n=1 Tax=Natrinema pallidum TaxID=69527 RepID=A0A4P9TCZ1_9EURY|nr:MFS transporter [Natrinema pallidum]QCW02598.1 MFS transporter [Natrinema pallidum]
MAEDSDSGAIADATTSFLADREDGDRVLETVLATDGEHATWTFDDIELDSGTFGELVSSGIVENADGEYRVADPAVVEAALTGDDLETDHETESADRAGGLERVRRGVDPRALIALLGALIVVAGARSTAVRAVFRHGRVVSPGNDPYYFRYWMETLVGDASGPLDYGVLVDTPAGVFGTRPFAHATNWVVAELLGGGQGATATVAAWLPVVASVALGVAIYACAVSLTRDARVGVASVLVFAVTPINAVYTGLGFLDHQFHQYFWLGITLLTLTRLAVDLQRRLETGGDGRAAVRAHLRAPATWLVAAAFGLSVTAGVHAWGGSPLLLVPLAGYVALRVAMDARAGLSPMRANLPLFAGLAIGSALSLALHHRWGWHAEFVATTPALVLAGSIAVAALGELWQRLSVHLGGLLALEGGVAAAGLLAFRQLQPADWAAAMARAQDLFAREGATETASLFSTEYFVIFGPLYQLGMGFYIALAVLGWVAWLVSRRYEPGWLLVGTYAGSLLVLAGIQVRFAGQLAIPLAVLTGLGLVRLLAVVDLARPPVSVRDPEPARPGRADDEAAMAADGGLEPAIAMPDGRRLAYLLGIGLLVFGLSLVYVPSLTADVTYSEAQLEAVDAIDDHAEAANRTYPDTYVLSEWGDNRMYNHFINGESRSYGYAKNNYEAFVTSPDPDDWYDTFNGRVGYVVVTEFDDRDIPDDSAQARLLENQGAGGADTDGLAHYQALSVADDVAAFAVVPGATLTVPGEPGTTVTVETDVSVSGDTIAYERRATVGDDGQATVTVPYAGEYAVGDRTATVTEADVLDGRSVAVGA